MGQKEIPAGGPGKRKDGVSRKTTSTYQEPPKNSTTDHHGEAIQALRDAGLNVDAIDYDGKLHRIPLFDKPGGRDGAYIAHADPPASVWFQNWKTGQTGTWTAKGQSDLTEEDRTELSRRMERTRKERAAEDARRHAEAAKKAKHLYKAAEDCWKHDYLFRKGIDRVPGLKVHKGALVVSLHDESGAVVSLQFIDDKGTKRFLTGGKKHGCFFPIGGKDAEKPLIICEGLATGISIHHCTGNPVLVAFDAGNLKPVAELARAKYPHRVIILAADNDTKTEGNPGVTMATTAADSIRARVVIPESKDGSPVDFNDLHKERGPEAVRHCFEAVLNADITFGSDDAEEGPQEARDCILPPPPSVPMEAFPPQIADLLEEAEEAFAVPLQIPATCLLGMLSCLVGGSRLISLRPSWKEPGNIWIATVAASGIGKTPCAAAFFGSIKHLEYEAFLDWKDEYADYENELEIVRKERSKIKRGEPMPERPDKPRRRQAYVDDATVEALGEVLSENPRGIMWRKDELSGLIADLDKYSSGSGGGTRSRLLSAYDGQEWKTNRTSNPSRNLYIPHAYVGIFGGIQPAMLPKVFEAGAAGVDEASGFLQRFILIRAEREKPGYWTERYLSDASKDLLDSIVAVLWSWGVEYDVGGREVEKVVPVSYPAKAAYTDWFNAIAQEEFLSQNAALLSKLKGQAQRICLLLHCLDAALAGADGMTPVTEDCMRRALLLADWIKVHQEQCWQFFKAEKPAKQTDPIERAIMQVIVDQAAKIETDGWRISNAELCSLVESNLGMTGISSRKIGRSASGLGLPSCWVTSKDKGRTVTREKIVSFKTNVGNVGNVGEPITTRVFYSQRNVGATLVDVGSGGHRETTTNVTNVEPTSHDDVKTLIESGQPTKPTLPTFDSGTNVEFDHYDPSDEVLF